MSKQWKTTIYLSEEKIPHIVFGDTHDELKEEAMNLLWELKPDLIRSDRAFYRKERGRWVPRLTASDMEAYEAFCRSCLSIERGPEYTDRGFVDGRFRLEYVKTTSKYHDVDQVNKMLKRGWHILGLERDEDAGITTTWYVLGHVEADAM
jgi:hypothetical protein